MDDALLVSAMRKREPRGLAGVYDKYSTRLYAYCWFLLRDHDTAADALYDSMLIAANCVQQLREADKLRPWLYSITRGECHRLARHADRSADMDVLDEAPGDTASTAIGSREDELRSIVWSAYERLGARSRELLELSVRHGMDRAELALVFSTSVERVSHLETRARTELDDSLAPLMLARTGTKNCSQLAAVVEGWDGRASSLPRGRVIRHIQECARCRTRRKQGIDTLAMLRMLPVAQLPGSLRHSVLTDGFDQRLESFREGLGRHARPFNDAGFPISYERRRRRAMALPTAVAAAAVVTGVAVSAAMLLPTDPHTATLATAPGPKTSAAAPGPASDQALAPASPSASPSTSAMAGIARTSPARVVTAPVQANRSTKPGAPRVSKSPTKPPQSPPPKVIQLHSGSGTVDVPMKGGTGTATFSLSASGGIAQLGQLTSSDNAVTVHASGSQVGTDAPVTVTVTVTSTSPGSATITVPWTSGGAVGIPLNIKITWTASAQADPSPSPEQS